MWSRHSRRAVLTHRSVVGPAPDAAGPQRVLAGQHRGRRSTLRVVLWKGRPLRWTEQAYPDLIYFNEVDKGNHFAAWEEPDLFTTEVRAAFRSLRSANGDRHE